MGNTRYALTHLSLDRYNSVAKGRTFDFLLFDLGMFRHVLMVVLTLIEGT